jgi:hypothetical protein
MENKIFDELLQKELGNVIEALSYVDNQQDAQEILNFTKKTLDKRKNFRRTLELVNEIKDCAIELSKIAPDLIFCVTDCAENREVSIDFQELYDALNETLLIGASIY